MAETDSDTLDEATEIANQIQELIVGRHTAAVMYALGMVYACGVVQSRAHMDISLALFRKIVGFEVDRHAVELGQSPSTETPSSKLS